MILNPSVLALLVSSLLVSSMVLYSSVYGARILRHWDITSGSERQLALERRTYLISTILSYFLGIQLISLFLFVFTADSLCTLFVGAMCAVGTLTVNAFGYPTLILKLVNFLLAGLWLILNHADNAGYDYPLIRKKYAFLMVLAPLIVAEAALEIAYFTGMHPDIITSCCGSLFSSANRGIAAELAGAPLRPVQVAFFAGMGLTISTGIVFIRTQRLGALFALLAGASFLVALVAVISFISLYYYEMPSHHCPFCLLQPEYHFIGYPLYLTLLLGAVSGMGVGILMPFRARPSLAATLPAFQHRLALTAVVSYTLFTLIALWPMVFSTFRLDG